MKSTNNLFSISVLPYWIILFIDLSSIITSLFLAYLVRFHFEYATLDEFYVMTGAGVMCALSLPVFRVFKTYRSVLRYASFIDIANIFFALVVLYLLSGIVSLCSGLFLSSVLIPYSILPISFVFNFALMSVVRIFVRIMFDSFNMSRSYHNVFVYGAQAEGINMAKAIKANSKFHYRLKGFISDDAQVVGKYLLGVEAYGIDDELFHRMERMNVKTVIVTPTKLGSLKDSALIEQFHNHRIHLLTFTSFREWGPDGLQSGDIKEIQIEDLLQRDPIRIDMHRIAEELEGKRVLITGAAGSIGSEIMRQVARFNPHSLILVDQAETPLHDIRLELQSLWRDLDARSIVADITNRTRMESIIRTYRPEYIFHAAAYKHVPMMEDNVCEAIQNNVGGTRNIADLAVKYGVRKFVMVSTDKAVNPTNIMGCSKRLCEIYVQSLSKKLQREGTGTTEFITTRFGNVLGSNGSVIPLFKKQIQKGGPVTVTHPDIIRYFMTIPEACQLVLEAGSMGHGGEIYIFDMGEPVKILDLAKRMIYLSGRSDVKIEFTGLRHGEKLYEELLNTKELTIPTDHHKIMVAKVREYDFDEVSKNIDELITLTYSYDRMKVAARMKEIVPEFVSKNSEYEVLDKKEEAEYCVPNI